MGKQEIITFKVDAGLAEAIKDMPNRSEFIRQAILGAMENTCPVCHGTGTLTPKQKEHWAEFLEHHETERCDDCHTLHLVCKTD